MRSRPFVDGPGTLVVGTDGTPPSQRALRVAFELARDYEGRLVAVHAVTTPIAYDMFGRTFGVPDWDPSAELRNEVERLAEDWDVPVIFVSTIGSPSAALVKVARERLADAVVVGSSRHSWHRLVGSASVGVVRRCPCPVIVVP